MYQVLLKTRAEGEDEVKKLTKDDGDTEEKLVSKSITMVQDTAKKTAGNPNASNLGFVHSFGRKQPHPNDPKMGQGVSKQHQPTDGSKNLGASPTKSRGQQQF